MAPRRARLGGKLRAGLSFVAQPAKPTVLRVGNCQLLGGGCKPRAGHASDQILAQANERSERECQPRTRLSAVPGTGRQSTPRGDQNLLSLPRPPRPLGDRTCRPHRGHQVCLHKIKAAGPSVQRASVLPRESRPQTLTCRSAGTILPAIPSPTADLPGISPRRAQVTP